MATDDDEWVPEWWRKARNEEELFRQQQAAEEREAARRRQAVDMLVGGIGPWDDRPLPSWWVMRTYNLKRWGRRPGGY